MKTPTYNPAEGIPPPPHFCGHEGIPHILSLGAGVQSSTMALMAAHGELEPMPTAAIFADTQAEPPSVYEWLDWLEEQLPFPVHRVTAGDLEEYALKMRVSKKGKRYSTTALPLFTHNKKDNSLGRIPHRTCTVDFKIKPITKEIRRIVGAKVIRDWHRQARSLFDGKLQQLHDDGGDAKAVLVQRGDMPILVTQWIGISTDEFARCKPSRIPWSSHRFPLIEKRISRKACMEWMQHRGYPEPPRSACVFCPFHAPTEWRRLQIKEPEQFERAVQFERDLQDAKGTSDNFASIPYLHRSCKPLDTIDFRSDVEHGQQLLPGWQDECEGMCGL